jgi:hypothetical protein
VHGRHRRTARRTRRRSWSPVALGGWARARVAGNRVPPLLVAQAVGLWLVAVPSLWEFGDGVDAFPLVPIPPSAVAEPTRAVIARAEWNSILAGILVIALAGAALLAVRRGKDRSAPPTGTDRRRLEAADEPG